MSRKYTKEFKESIVKMIHSDMGSQYTSQLFESTLELYGLIHSYSLKGYPYDNAFIESFYSFLKR